MRDSRRARHHTYSEILIVAKPRTAHPSAPNTPQDSAPAAVAAVTEGTAVGAPQATDEARPEQSQGQFDSAAPVASAADTAAADQGAGASEESQSPDADTPAEAAAVADSSVDSDFSNGAWLFARFRVLSPFKYKGNVVKPPEWIRMGWEEARPYQDAGVLGEEPAPQEEPE
jgi:hypothetical protein